MTAFRSILPANGLGTVPWRQCAFPWLGWAILPQADRAIPSSSVIPRSALLPPVPFIPRSVLFGNPVKTSPKLSPDGELLAYIAPDGGVLNAWVKTAAQNDERPVTRDRGVRFYILGGVWRRPAVNPRAAGQRKLAALCHPHPDGKTRSLVGAPFTPDVFCGAIDVVGPNNLITPIETIPTYWSALLSTCHQRVGNPSTEAEFLKSRSPLFQVDCMRIPIAQGANDPRVEQSEAEQLVAAMRDRGIDHEYLLFPDAGHGFAKPENRIAFYAAAERLLSKHLGGRCEP